MAVHPEYPGLEVDIVVDGVPLKEHPPPADFDETIYPWTIIRYIEATPGAKFGVRYRSDPSFKYCQSSIRRAICIDGVIDRIVMHWGPGNTNAILCIEDGVETRINRQLMKQDFVFGTLDTGKCDSSYFDKGRPLKNK